MLPQTLSEKAQSKKKKKIENQNFGQPNTYVK